MCVCVCVEPGGVVEPLSRPYPPPLFDIQNQFFTVLVGRLRSSALREVFKGKVLLLLVFVVVVPALREQEPSQAPPFFSLVDPKSILYSA